MKKICVTVILVSAFLIHGFHGTGLADTYIYSLTQYGNEVGKWGIEVNTTGNIVNYKSKEQFPDNIRNLQLLKNLVGKKNVTVDISQHQKITEMEYGALKWGISSSGEEVLVKRFEESRSDPVDELEINPLLPTYDLTSFLFSFQNNSHEENFDFYLIEEHHEKRLRAIRRGAREWRLMFETYLLAQINLSEDGIPESIYFGDSYFKNLRGYSLTLACSRSSSLVARPVITPANAIDSFVAKYKWIRKSEGSCAGRFVRYGNAYNAIYNNRNCLSINKDVTVEIINIIIQNMKGQSISNHNHICVQYDAGQQVFYPALESQISHESIKLIDITKEISDEISNNGGSNTRIDETFLDGSEIVIPYSYNILKQEKETREIDLQQKFIDAGIKDAEYINKFKIIKKQERDLIVEGSYKAGFFYRTEKIGRIIFDINNYARSDQIPGLRIISTVFDTSHVESRGKLLVKYDIEKNVLYNKKKRIVLVNEFARRYGIPAKFIRCQATLQKYSFGVTYELKRSFDINKSRVIDGLRQRLVPQEMLRPSVALDTGADRYLFTGHGGLSLSQDSIFRLYNIPMEAKVKMQGNSLICTYFDLSCPRKGEN